MALQDPFEDLPDVEEKSHDSDDEDFNPAAAVSASESSSSESEDNAVAKPAQRKRKRKAPPSEELDSGDEVTIKTAQKQRAKRRRGGAAKIEDDLIASDDEGGEGGLVKTRAQRRVEEKERRPLAGIEGATIDVDAIWAQMSAAPLIPKRVPLQTEPEKDLSDAQKAEANEIAAAAEAENETDLVSVRKIYTFAGQRTTEEKEVPRRTLEQHLADGWKEVDAVVEAPESKPETTEKALAGPQVHRPLRRPSRFDANPTGYVRALPPEHQLTWPRKTATITAAEKENLPAPEAPKAARPEKAQKLNVVDKSRLDWTGFVAKEGIAEELDVHGKTKEAYLGRMEFLAGVEAKREEERRRLKTAAAS